MLTVVSAASAADDDSFDNLPLAGPDVVCVELTYRRSAPSGDIEITIIPDETVQGVVEYLHALQAAHTHLGQHIADFYAAYLEDGGDPITGMYALGLVGE